MSQVLSAQNTSLAMAETAPQTLRNNHIIAASSQQQHFILPELLGAVQIPATISSAAVVGDAAGHLQASEASKSKCTASRRGSPSTGTSRRVFFFKLTALRMVAVLVICSTGAGGMGVCGGECIAGMGGRNWGGGCADRASPNSAPHSRCS